MVIHYDKDLSGHIACGYSRYDYANEDIKKVTCRRCLKQAEKDKAEYKTAIIPCPHCGVNVTIDSDMLNNTAH